MARPTELEQNHQGPSLHLDLNQAGQSTNTWSHLIPSGRLPEQIHNGEAAESQTNVRHLLAGDDPSYNTENVNSVLKNLQNPSLIYTQGGNPNVDPKNLRNFFIQSSLTFNGNNLPEEKIGSGLHEQESEGQNGLSPVVEDGHYENDESLALNMLNQHSLNPANNCSMINASNVQQFKTHQ